MSGMAQLPDLPETRPLMSIGRTFGREGERSPRRSTAFGGGVFCSALLAASSGGTGEIVRSWPCGRYGISSDSAVAVAGLGVGSGVWDDWRLSSARAAACWAGVGTGVAVPSPDDTDGAGAGFGTEAGAVEGAVPADDAAAEGEAGLPLPVWAGPAAGWFGAPPSAAGGFAFGISAPSSRNSAIRGSASRRQNGRVQDGNSSAAARRPQKYPENLMCEPSLA